LLTQDQVAFYKDNGYLHLAGLIEAEFLASLQHETADLIERMQATAPIPAEGRLREAVFREPVPPSEDPLQGAVFAIMDLQNFHPLYTRLLVYTPIVNALNDLIGPGVALHHARMITKGSKKKTVGSQGWVVTMHQDQSFFPHRDHSLVAAFMPLVDTTIENGALHVVPGSHKLGPIEHFPDNNGGYRLKSEEWPLSRGTPVMAKAGDVLFFNYLTVHGSSPNQSNARRTALIFQYRSAIDQPLNDAHHDSAGIGMRLA